MSGKYRSKNKPYSNVELRGSGSGTRGGGGGSATLTAERGRAKAKLQLGGSFYKGRPIESVDINEYNILKGLDLTVPVGPADVTVGASEERFKYQEKNPDGTFKYKPKPQRNFRAGMSVPVGPAMLDLTGNVSPRSPGRKRKIGARVGLRIPLNKGGTVKSKSKKKK
tara:strand:+ start:2244 stop:2744 length:501 start_codon:yes stop_codon:yes gene_type:complete